MNFWVVMAGILVVAYNVMSILRPIPVGWDDTNFYAYIPRQITHLKGLLPDVGGMYNWELINSIGTYISGDAMLNLFTNVGGGLLGLLAVFLLMRKFVSQRIAGLLAVTFYMFPAVVFQASIDIKTDMALMLFVFMGLIAFKTWFEKNDKSWLAFAAVLLGIAMGIKATAVLVVIALILFIVQRFMKWEGAVAATAIIVGGLLFVLGRGNQFGITETATQIAGLALFVPGFVYGIYVFFKSSKKKELIVATGIFAGVILATIMPWMIKNITVDGLPISMSTIIASDLHHEVESIKLSAGVTCTVEKLSNEFEKYVTSGDEPEGLWGVIKMPWQTTMNPGSKGIYIDISFIFFALLPLILWWVTEKKNKVFNGLLGAVAIYYGLLIFFFHGVIWYGFAGLIILLMLVGMMLQEYEKSTWEEEKIFEILIKTTIAVTVISAIFVRISAFGSINYLSYLGGLIDEDEYIDSINPGVLATKELLTDEVVYKTGGALPYFMAATDVKIFSDESMDKFMCLASNMTGSEIVDEFKRNNIEYVSVDFTLMLKEGTDPLLVQRYGELITWGKNYLETVIEDTDYILFRVP